MGKQKKPMELLCNDKRHATFLVLVTPKFTPKVLKEMKKVIFYNLFVTEFRVKSSTVYYQEASPNSTTELIEKPCLLHVSSHPALNQEKRP
jgi:hypothetical protein